MSSWEIGPEPIKKSAQSERSLACPVAVRPPTGLTDQEGEQPDRMIREKKKKEEEKEEKK